MEQNTNAEAFIRLRPLETNVGAIVTEHIRYWKKYDDAKEAQKKANKARQAQLQAQRRNKENEFVLKNLSIDDSSGYFREQIVSDFERRKPEIVALRRKAFNGDNDAILKLSTIMQEFKDLVSLDKLSGEAIKKLADSSDKRNPLLDRGKESFANNVAHNNYLIRNGKIGLLNRDGEVDLFSPKQMRQSLLSLGEYSGKFDPSNFGSEIASTIKLDDINGNKRTTEQIRVEGIKKVQNSFTQNDVASRSWILSKRDELSNEENKSLSDVEFIRSLDNVQLTNLATQFYDEEVSRNLQQVDRSLANSNTRETIAKKARDRRKAKREEDLGFAIATEDGEVLTTDLEKVGKDIFNTELSKGGTAFTIANGEYDVGSGTSKTRELVEGGILQDGNIKGLIVKKTITTPARDGEIDQETGKAKKIPASSKTITRYVTDKDEINAIGNRLGLGNEEGIRQGAIDVIGEQKSETIEERRARLRKEAGLN